MMNRQFPMDARVQPRTWGAGHASIENLCHLGDKGCVIGPDMDGFILVAYDHTGVESYMPSGNDLEYLK